MTTENTPPSKSAGRSQDIFAADQTFASLGLSEPILRAITERGYVHPTRIQADLIPIVLSGKDCLGQAKTGTGKTAAFALPALHMIPKDSALSVLILVPTRELAIQVAKEISEFAKFSGHQVVPIYGGQPISTQVQEQARSSDHRGNSRARDGSARATRVVVRKHSIRSAGRSRPNA